MRSKITKKNFHEVESLLEFKVLYCDVENHLLEIDKVEKFEFIKSKITKKNFHEVESLLEFNCIS